MNLDRPGLQFDGLPVTRQIIGALALDLDGGVLRRNLLDQAGEPRQQFPDRLGGGPDLAGLDDLALSIVGIAFLAPGDREAVALAAVHHERDGLGSLAERDRQAPGGERIEGSGMAGALGLEQPLHHRDRVGRGHADRLVEHDPAVDVALVAPGLVILTRLLAAAPAILVVTRIRRNIFFGAVRIADLRLDQAVGGGHDHQVSSESGARSLCTAGVRSNFSIRSASSNRSSAWKRISGANFRLTRRAISPRRNFLLRSSAAITTSVSRPPSGIT